MLFRTLAAWKRLAATLGILLALVLAGGGLFVWSGIYNVSAARDHFDVTTWILEHMRDRSVATHSAFVEVPPLADDNMIRLGGAHYEGVCSPCHARPGTKINVVVSRMLPSPPSLVETLRDNTAEEVFWIVKHGLKYTGMPAFPTLKRDDEVAAITAFLMDLAKGDPRQRYAATAGLDRVPGGSGAAAAGSQVPGADRSALTQCVRCHDDRGTATHADRIPRLAGQPVEYLRRSLAEYAAGTRASGIMQPVADALTPADLDRFAAYYAQLPPPDAMAARPGADAEKGRRLAEAGDPNIGVPACLSCHGPSASPQFPRLAGQNAVYIETQLALWRDGGRVGTTYGRIMAVVARRLSEADIRNVATYFASRPAETKSAARGDQAPGR